MQRKFNLYDKVRIKTGKYTNKVGVIVAIKHQRDRYVYTVSNHHEAIYPLGSFYAYEIMQISVNEYLDNLLKH